MTRTVLITGISGFIANHTALVFLNAGYAVRGTVRSLAKADMVRDTLAKHADVSKLSFVEADLLSDDGWEEAVKGVDGIAHLASPFPLASPKDENDLIRPAVDGTLRVLRFASKHNIPRFVQTSSMAAIYAGHPHDRTAPFTEKDWTVLDGPGASAYPRSKTLAEKAARDFIADQGKDIHYASVNPGLVLGPLLSRDFGSSVDVITMIMSGKYPGIPHLEFPVVDVRDVANLHLRAMETGAPSGGRYLAVGGTMRFIEMSRAIRDNLGAAGRKAPNRELPNFLIRLVALFDPAVRSILPDLDRRISVDTGRTRSELGVEFIPAREAVIETAKSLVELKLV